MFLVEKKNWYINVNERSSILTLGSNLSFIKFAAQDQYLPHRPIKEHCGKHRKGFKLGNSSAGHMIRSDFLLN